ncbi:hypothetical protein EV191_11721 [Tamaricihabitans halophyticus]|uniref:Polyketide cyclase/dehydrase/lipid transport protein n=1 Tax=Tamaricihabitans halophyticus TaxID=1262583 RepID=A0A4R2QDQ3_9PSEU|nr:hypothetical protein [Tamaricihabitans halophyticus]TCP45055.1 hypothetical protein EV191_11721 [Tamaricihabitans halophyticus]
MRTTARHDVHEDGTGTRLVLELSWQGPLAPLIRLALGRKARHMVSQEAATFAQLAEADG